MQPVAIATTLDVPRVRPASVPVERPVPGLGIDSAEWRAFAATQANTLILGEPLAITRVLTAAWLTLRRPVLWCDGPRLALPTGQAGTFIIERLDELNADDQRRLLDWMDRRETTRVLAASPRGVFALVEQGTFVPELYYRLNPILLDATVVTGGVESSTP